MELCRSSVTAQTSPSGYARKQGAVALPRLWDSPTKRTDQVRERTIPEAFHVNSALLPTCRYFFVSSVRFACTYTAVSLSYNAFLQLSARWRHLLFFAPLSGVKYAAGSSFAPAPGESDPFGLQNRTALHTTRQPCLWSLHIFCRQITLGVRPAFTDGCSQLPLTGFDPAYLPLDFQDATAAYLNTCLFQAAKAGFHSLTLRRM